MPDSMPTQRVIWLSPIFIEEDVLDRITWSPVKQSESDVPFARAWPVKICLQNLITQSLNTLNIHLAWKPENRNDNFVIQHLAAIENARKLLKEIENAQD